MQTLPLANVGRSSRENPRGARVRLRTSDWKASVKAQVHRPQPKARSPREHATNGSLPRRAPGFRSLGAFVNLVSLLYRGLFMHNGPHGADHAHRAIGLEDVPPHVHAHGASLHGIGSELQGFHLRRLFAARDDHRYGATLHQLLKLLAIVG